MSPTSRCFVQRDLYSTFFGTSVNDEIERRLFGHIDTQGSKAVKAFAGEDIAEWHRHFQTLFEYIDIQKIRTPKGLDWLKAQYPSLTQNELMWEMQGIRNLHCTIWTEGVREIVSAEDADAKFIIKRPPCHRVQSRHSAQLAECAYPNDPSIALKASQTISAQPGLLPDPDQPRVRSGSNVHPLEKRTFARNFRHSMVRTDAFIRTRKLDNSQVIQINRVLKGRARRFVAAGRADLLHPEDDKTPWADLRHTLARPITACTVLVERFLRNSMMATFTIRMSSAERKRTGNS